MNIVDFVAICPFYVSLILEGLEDLEIIGKTGKIIRLVRVMRILRVFKLVRHFAGLQSLLYTLQQAYKVAQASLPPPAGAPAGRPGPGRAARHQQALVVDRRQQSS